MGTGDASAPAEVIVRIENLFARMSAAWATHDFAFLRSVWAASPTPVYLAEEAPGFVRGHAGLDAYWAQTEAGLHEVRGDYRVESVTPLAPPLFVVTFTNDWAAVEQAGEPAVAGTCRGVMIVETRGEAGMATLTPRVYVEAPLAPLLYVRELYKLVARTRGLG